ncbi:L-threonylcarbamoyladenylate synthase [Haliangium sp.]|uniref:L-threonylcarbamoyladenylate synthase n=1 Tax=Haliangium sp. TaxID=2663208 RepID=UPI003D0CEC2D
MTHFVEAVRAGVDASTLAQATAVLRAGGVVCTPTETTYGLAADTRNPAAIEALVVLKGRDPQAPFGLIVADRAQARALTRVWPEPAEAMARAHWPGPLTLVVPARPKLPAALVGPDGGVGVRISSHPVPVALARALGAAITATSANPAGAPPALDVTAARAYFGDAVYYIDGGPAPAQAASTVVTIDDHGQVRLLRAGPVDVSAWLPSPAPA